MRGKPEQEPRPGSPGDAPRGVRRAACLGRGSPASRRVAHPANDTRQCEKSISPRRSLSAPAGAQRRRPCPHPCSADRNRTARSISPGDASPRRPPAVGWRPRRPRALTGCSLRGRDAGRLAAAAPPPRATRPADAGRAPPIRAPVPARTGGWRRRCAYRGGTRRPNRATGQTSNDRQWLATPAARAQRRPGRRLSGRTPHAGRARSRRGPEPAPKNPICTPHAFAGPPVPAIKPA